MPGRLRTQAEFDRVRRLGSFRGGRCCSVSAVRQLPDDISSSGLTRFGLITSRKIGNAVQRNRARRIIRESLRHLAAMLEPGWDIVVIARPAITAPGVRMQDVRDELQWLLTQAHLVRAV